MASSFVSSLVSHGVYKCYAEDLFKAIREQAPAWQADGQDRIIEADTSSDICYPVEYHAGSGRVFVHLFDQARIASGSDGEVSKSFAYPSGEPLAHKVAFDLQSEVANCRIFEGNPHIIQIVHVGQKGVLFEYMNGGSLTQFAKQLPTIQKVAVVKQLLQAVAVIHAKGVVHRDLRPANILCKTDANGAITIKVADFACAVTSGQRNHIQGHLSYRSERLLQCSIHEVYDRVNHYVPCPQDDLWAVGVTIYELAHGKQPPFCEIISDLFRKNLTKPEMDEALTALQKEIAIFTDQTLEKSGLDTIIYALLTGKASSAAELITNPLFEA